MGRCLKWKKKEYGYGRWGRVEEGGEEGGEDGGLVHYYSKLLHLIVSNNFMDWKKNLYNDVHK